MPPPSLCHLPAESGGYCQRCRRQHRLGPGTTLSACLELMDRLKRENTIDLFGSGAAPDPDLRTDYLFGPARGKMFGILEGRDQGGQHHLLYAFSGQYNGRWLVEGWAPPLFDSAAYQAINEPREREIKALGREIDKARDNHIHSARLRRERVELSRRLMRELHGLYRLPNFRGEELAMQQAFLGGKAMPTGTGDCCAPKLLGAAARLGLWPLGLSEFYWGRENRSGNRRHGAFSPPCREKCAPILGFLLCGLDREEDAR